MPGDEAGLPWDEGREEVTLVICTLWKAASTDGLREGWEQAGSTTARSRCPGLRANVFRKQPLGWGGELQPEDLVRHLHNGHLFYKIPCYQQKSNLIVKA